MQSGARYQAVLDLITEIFRDMKPADGIINDYLRARKYIGSKDRRFITDFTWSIIRNRMKLTFDAGSNLPRRILLTAVRDKLDQVFDGSQYGLAPLTEEEKAWLAQANEEVYPDYVEAECPEWLYAKIKNSELCKALNTPAPADFRVNLHERGEVQRQLQAEGIEMTFTPFSPIGLRCGERLALGNCVAHQEGRLEVQDEASQLAAILCDVRPEHKIIDYCCGAGGKSLALAHLLNNQGHILAHDVNSRRLEAIKPRLQRLGIKNIELTDFVADSDRDFDRFIIDAPCSGTGTWRRAPDGKYRLSAAMLENLTRTQADILEKAAPKVKPGGRIIYITCSVLPEENEQIMDKFLAAHPEFSLTNLRSVWEKYIDAPYPHRSEKMLRMSPLMTGTDGFFICVLEKCV